MDMALIAIKTAIRIQSNRQLKDVAEVRLMVGMYIAKA
jgi:hypothetical protein